jgi:hypothetical protein
MKNSKSVAYGIGVGLLIAILVLLTLSAFRQPTVIEKPVYVQPAWWGSFGYPWGGYGMPGK